LTIAHLGGVASLGIIHLLIGELGFGSHFEMTFVQCSGAREAADPGSKAGQTEG